MVSKTKRNMVEGLPVNIRDFGAKGDGVTDDTQAVREAIAYAVDNNIRTILVPSGDFLITEEIDAKSGSKSFRGEHSATSRFVTNADIAMFTVLGNTSFFDIGFEQIGTQYTGKALQSTNNQQWSRNVVERCDFVNLKWGIHLRYSLWVTFRDLRFKHCACGIRMARNDEFDADRTNPQAEAHWNLWNNGWFHNMIEMSSVYFEGGEVGIWGCPMGLKIDTITVQGQKTLCGPGETPVVLPDGYDPVGILFEPGRDNSATRDVTIKTLYAESIKSVIRLNGVQRVTVEGFFYQGGADYEDFRFLDAYNNSRIHLNNGYISDYAAYFIGANEGSEIAYRDIFGPLACTSGNWVKTDDTATVLEDTDSFAFPKRHIRQLDLPDGEGNGRVIPIDFEIEDETVVHVSLGYLRDGYADYVESWVAYRYNSSTGVSFARTDGKYDKGAAFEVTVGGTSDSAGTYPVSNKSQGNFTLQYNSSTQELELVQQSYGSYTLRGTVEVTSQFIRKRDGYIKEVVPKITTSSMS